METEKSRLLQSAVSTLDTQESHWYRSHPILKAWEPATSRAWVPAPGALPAKSSSSRGNKFALFPVFCSQPLRALGDLHPHSWRQSSLLFYWFKCQSLLEHPQRNQPSQLLFARSGSSDLRVSSLQTEHQVHLLPHRLHLAILGWMIFLRSTFLGLFITAVNTFVFWLTV